MDEFQELCERVVALTGLSQREAAQVAFAFDEGAVPSPAQIVDMAIELGYDVEAKHANKTDTMDEPIAEVTFDPAVVLEEVFLMCPRVLMSATPVLGRAPDQALELFADELANLPEDIIAALVKINIHEGEVTVWVRDEANDLDRPIGPISIKHMDSESALNDAILTLFKRLPRVLAADTN
jgi:hypothetical protein